MYYRLFDTQVSRNMATGCNTTSEAELLEHYWSYKSADMDDEELETCQKWSLEEQKNFMLEDGFEIETSEKPFVEEY